MRDVPGCERWCVRARGCGPDGGAAPDAPAMPGRAAHAQPADGSDGGRTDGADAGGRWILLLGQGSARTIRRFRRGLPDNFIHRRRHGDLSCAFCRLSFVHSAARPDGPGRDRRRAGLARGWTQLSGRPAGWDGVHQVWIVELLYWIKPRLPAGYRAYIGTTPTFAIGAPAEERPDTRTETDSPVASFICEATVRFQISS